MIPQNRNIILFAIYLVLITGLTIIYDYPETLLKRPQSIHNWRQCDGASIALNYYQEGMHFFKPQTHMLYSDNYTTGYSAPSEIPILYYFVAILYKIFGYHDYIFRAVNLLIFYIGLFYLFRLADKILKDVFYAAVVTVMIFTAPVLVYYANNFMPNSVALSFSIIAWYYFYKHCLNGRTKTFLLSVLFFGVAATMKITELTGPIILIILLTGDRLGIFKLGLHNKFGLKITSVLAIFAIVGGWVMYAKYFNSLHHSTQFSTFIFPLWNMKREAIDFTLHKINVIWFKDYFYPATFWLMVGCLIVMFILWMRSDKIIKWICFAEVIALIAFSILWFEAMGDHDYFYIGFYVLPAFLFINFFLVLKSSGLSKINASIIRFVFLGVIVINVYYARERHSLRYHGSWMNDYEEMKDMYTIGPWLNETGIRQDDTVIFYPSVYIRPLYLMNVKGWTIFNHDSATAEIEERDNLLMSTFSGNGAEYFVTNDIKSAVAYKPFEPYMKDLYAKYKSIFIFRLPPRQQNFNPGDSLLINY
ncbi:MAG TPA: glycosyltransferase family 39 protein [Bacteroidales bacterium]|jgi:hypothetical protein|nr:glycosyltransferase family 39 protein [Bacteroidales bacterium]